MVSTDIIALMAIKGYRSITALAETLDLPRTTVAMTLYGERRNAETVKAIETALDIDDLDAYIPKLQPQEENAA